MHVHVPPVFRFPEALLFWAVYLWVFVPEFKLVHKSSAPVAGAQDAGTMRLILVANQAALLLGFATAFTPWFVVPWPRTGLVIGTASLLLGGVLRRMCFRALGPYFTGAVIVREDQPVIDRGPYRWVRHPSYSAGFLIFFGIGVALGNWLSLAVLTLVPCLVYRRRVEVEEKALLATIGEPYRRYMSRTRRFVPFVL